MHSSLADMRNTTALLFILLTTTCQTPSLASKQDALLVAPDAASHSAIQQAASQLLGGVQVQLADDAFTRDSRISMERRVRNDPNGFRIDTPGEERPHLLRLIISASGCALRLESSGKQVELDGVRCKPVAAPD